MDSTLINNTHHRRLAFSALNRDMSSPNHGFRRPHDLDLCFPPETSRPERPFCGRGTIITCAFVNNPSAMSRCHLDAIDNNPANGP
jgi:hypothetical protein